MLSPQSPPPALPRIWGGNPQPPASPGGVKVWTPHLVPQSSRHHQRDRLSKRLPLKVNRTIVRETRRLQPTKKQFFVSAWHSPPLSPKSSAQSGQQIRPSPRLSTKEVCLPAADVSRRKAQRSQRTPHPPPPSGTLRTSQRYFPGWRVDTVSTPAGVAATQGTGLPSPGFKSQRGFHACVPEDPSKQRSHT